MIWIRNIDEMNRQIYRTLLFTEIVQPILLRSKAATLARFEPSTHGGVSDTSGVAGNDRYAPGKIEVQVVHP